MKTVREQVQEEIELLKRSGTPHDAISHLVLKDLHEYRDRSSMFRKFFSDYDEFFQSWDGTVAEFKL